jgi:hypothetical protein
MKAAIARDDTSRHHRTLRRRRRRGGDAAGRRCVLDGGVGDIVCECCCCWISRLWLARIALFRRGFCEEEEKDEEGKSVILHWHHGGRLVKDIVVEA